MKKLNTLFAILLALVFFISYGVLPANAEGAAPKGNKLLKADLLQVVDLGPEFDGMQGRQLRLRMLTIEPGGYIGMHSHKDRPAVVYFIQGTDTVTFEDGTSKVFNAGDTTSANKDTKHWHRNDGKEPVVLVTTDVFNSAK